MNARYRVVSALVMVTTGSDYALRSTPEVGGNKTKITVFHGGLLPEDVPQKELDHLLAVNMIKPLEPVAS